MFDDWLQRVHQWDELPDHCEDEVEKHFGKVHQFLRRQSRTFRPHLVLQGMKATYIASVVQGGKW